MHLEVSLAELTWAYIWMYMGQGAHFHRVSECPHHLNRNSELKLLKCIIQTFLLGLIASLFFAAVADFTPSKAVTSTDDLRERDDWFLTSHHDWIQPGVRCSPAPKYLQSLVWSERLPSHFSRKTERDTEPYLFQPARTERPSPISTFSECLIS